MTSQLSPAGATRNGIPEPRLPDSGGRILVEFDLPIRTVNSLNTREHWRTRSKRAKSERDAAFLLCRLAQGMSLPAYITMVRYGPRAMDGDGLQASLKHVRDGIADRLGVDDGDPRIVWRYEQIKQKTYEVRVRIEFIP